MGAFWESVKALDFGNALIDLFDPEPGGRGMKVGFTGTRDGCTQDQAQQVSYLFSDLGGAEFHHGCCTGADADAMFVIMEQFPDAVIVGHPPDNDAMVSMHARPECHEMRPPLPYLVRNKNIVNETDVLFACPKGPEELRSGTWSTVRYARKLGRRIIIIHPDGSVQEEDGE